MRFSLSYRDVEELLSGRGIPVDDVTLWRRVRKLPGIFRFGLAPAGRRAALQGSILRGGTETSLPVPFAVNYSLKFCFILPGRLVAQPAMQPRVVPDTLLGHIAPLGWEHISFNGDYVWASEPLKERFRPLRNPRSVFLDAA